MDYGFVITRHVNSEETNLLWMACVKQVQKIAPNCKIVIIDDNSKYEYVKNVKNVDLSNCTVIDSEFKGSGEYLPYYYFYKNKWFDKMIFLHDSVFMNDKIDVSNIDTVKFLWHFNGGESLDENFINNIERLINSTKSDYTNDLITFFKTYQWKGCYGVMSVMNHNYLVQLFDKYNLVELANHIKNRHDRISFEHIFGLICCYDNRNLNENNISIYGHNTNNAKTLSDHGEKSLKDHLKDIDDSNFNIGILKLFFGR